jgi:hypothetical protein
MSRKRNGCAVWKVIIRFSGGTTYVERKMDVGRAARPFGFLPRRTLVLPISKLCGNDMLFFKNCLV